MGCSLASISDRRSIERSHAVWKLSLHTRLGDLSLYFRKMTL